MKRAEKQNDQRGGFGSGSWLGDSCEVCKKPFQPISADIPKAIADYLKAVNICSECCQQILKNETK